MAECMVGQNGMRDFTALYCILIAFSLDGKVRDQVTWGSRDDQGCRDAMVEYVLASDALNGTQRYIDAGIAGLEWLQASRSL